MKKFLLMFAAMILLASCSDSDVTFQNGVVVKIERIDLYGYKYRAKVENHTMKGYVISYYTLLTNYNYRIGDTITIK